MFKTHRQLHKIDPNGIHRLWWVEQPTETSYQICYGRKDGKIARTRPTEVGVGKQTRTVVEQTAFEITSLYTYQLDRDYFELHEDASVPKHIFPMLAQKYKKFAPGYVQPKLDGMRCIATAKGLFSRQGQPILSVPHIRRALELFFSENPDAVLDGELYNHDLKHDFERLMSLCRKTKDLTPEVLEQTKVIQYHVYDFPSAPGGFGQRWEALKEPALPWPEVQRVDTQKVLTEEEYDTYDAAWLDDGYEGSMWRDANGEYEFDQRPNSLQKRVVMLSEEFELVRLVEGVGNWAGAAKSAEFKLPNGDTFSAGIRGTYEKNKALLEGPQPKIGTVSFKGWTKAGKPRCGVVKDWDRTDA